jgi:hypothetical protein
MSGDVHVRFYERLGVRFPRATHLLLGFAGPHSEAEKIKGQLRDFLRDDLKLEMSEEKTKITHARRKAARFLGYEIHTIQGDQQVTRGQRAINGKIGLKVPYPVITEKCARYMKGDTSVHRAELLNSDVYDIIEQYQAEYRGFVEYYRLAYNLSKVSRLRQVTEVSLTKTLAAKLKISVGQVYSRFSKNLLTDKGPQKVLRHVVVRKNKPPLVAQWGNVSLKWNKQATIREPAHFPWNNRVQLIDRLLADICELCGSRLNVEVHHINHMKTLRKKGRITPPLWVFTMASRNRKTLVVCSACHQDIHRGRPNVAPFPKQHRRAG